MTALVSLIASISINNVSLFSQLTFEGITGSSFTSDIAIDNVTVTEGDCPGKTKHIESFVLSSDYIAHPE